MILTASLAKWLMRLPRERKIPSSNPACGGIFSGSSHTSGFKIGTPMAALPGAWRYRVSAGTGWPDVSVLWLGEMENLVCNFYLSVAVSRSVPEILWYVAGTLSNQQINLRYLLLPEKLRLPDIAYYLSQVRYLIHCLT